MPNVIQIHPADNVAVALSALSAGEGFALGGTACAAAQEVPAGHKVALAPIAAGAPVVKYGYPIGLAKQDIAPGQWVHTHNLKTGLAEETSFRYAPNIQPPAPVKPEHFQGYLRPDGRAGIRNEIWILPTVGCVNEICEEMARNAAPLAQQYGFDGVYAFPHPYGCSQMGDDHLATQKLLAALAKHPNAGGVLVVGLGCENNTMESFQAVLGEWDKERTRFLVCQEVADEVAEGGRLLGQLATALAGDKRQALPVSKLVVGMKCGGSDGLSGITANPTVGRFSDMLIARGGSTLLTEVPEMFGAEQVLLNRAVSQEVFDKGLGMINAFKQYFVSHDQVVYENPSPGNKQGGISTLEDKSLGCVQKGGTAPVTDVIGYAEQVKLPGLTLLSGPGNDLVSATALTAAGAHMVLFTTGRGTPFGAPAPTVKISTNNALFQKKPGWVDFNAGPVAEGEPLDAAAARLLAYVIQVASGQKTRNEQRGYRGIAIFKDGVVL